MSQVKYFTQKEIALHNTKEDLWVIVFGKVLDLTQLLKKHKDDTESFPLLAFGGKDISHFFFNQSQVKHHINPETNQVDAFTPFGKFIDAPSQEQAEEANMEQKKEVEELVLNLMERIKQQKFCKDKKEFPDTKLSEKENKEDEESLPWWKNNEYVIGKVTSQSRRIKIRDTFTKVVVELEVCYEETVDEILEKYLKFNSHARSCIWKVLGQELIMDKTLSENEVSEMDLKAEQLGLINDIFIPTLNLYYYNE